MTERALRDWEAGVSAAEPPAPAAPRPGARATGVDATQTQAQAGGTSVRLEGVRKSFGTCVAVDDVSLDVREGELLAILGPSGCGKTTLLRLVAGLERQDAGRIVLHGRDVGGLPPAARGCGVVFQSYALFPTLTAAQNVAFGIDRRRYGRRERMSRAAALLEQVGLSYAAGKYPAQLSGGQQQRVALARALATDPALLLLDEPLSALDAKVRATLRVEIRRLQQAKRLTTLLVTHDQEEAMTMADRVAVMNAGKLAQVDMPAAVYRRPADAFTAAFVGVMNLLAGWTVAEDGALRREGMVLRAVDAPVGAKVTAAFRPEEARLLAEGGAARESAGRDNVLACRVERSEFRGAFVRHYVTLAGAEGETILVDDAAGADLKPGSVAQLHVPAESIRAFASDGASR